MARVQPLQPISSLLKLRHPGSYAQRAPFLELTENLLVLCLMPWEPEARAPLPSKQCCCVLSSFLPPMIGVG